MNTLCVCVCALHAEVRISLGNSLIHSLVNHALQTNLVLSPDCAQTPLVIQACGLLIRGQRSFHSGLTTNHLVGDPTVSLLWNGVKCGSAKPTTGNPRGFALLEDNVFGTLWSTWSIRSPFIAALRHLAVARAIEIQSKCSSSRCQVSVKIILCCFPVVKTLNWRRIGVIFKLHVLLCNCVIFFWTQVCILLCTDTCINTEITCLPLYALGLSLTDVLDKIGLLQTTHLCSCWMKEHISDWEPLWKRDITTNLPSVFQQHSC